MHPIKAIRLAPLAIVLLTACGGGKIPTTRYYSLNLPGTPQPVSVSGRQSVAVARLGAPDLLTQNRIVYRPTEEEVGFYEYHRWAEDPRDAIRRALIERLRGSGAFSAVARYDGRTNTDFLLRGRVERLEEVDFEEGVRVYSRIAAELIDLSNNRVVWQGSGSGMGQVDQSEVRAVVSKMSQAVRTSLDELVESLSAYLAS